MRKADAVHFFENAGKQLKEVELSAIAVVVMAHGTENDEIKFSDDKKCKLRKLLQPLLTCPNINGKPKIVVTQCCRGTNFIAGQMEPDSEEEETVMVDGDLRQPVRVNDQVRITQIFSNLIVYV